MKTIFRKILECVQQGQTVALATVISSKGSLPMSKRAKMLVFADGSIQGTIGGGMVEAQVIDEAQDVLQTCNARIVRIDLTSDQIEADGLTCGGTVEILVECFTPQSEPEVFEAILQTMDHGQTAVIASLLPDAEPNRNPAFPQHRKILIQHDGSSVGTTGSEQLDAAILKLAHPKLGQPFLKTCALNLTPSNPSRVFLETLLPPPTAYLFGGGHISSHLSNILHFIGFDYVVIDDRPEFLTHERFPEAKALICQSFEHIFDALTLIPRASYLIIVTRGHKSDQVVLMQALRTEATYIGMIGSRRKIHLMFEHLQAQGIPQTMLERIHAPIGLEIGADTPEEIAISIAAELIQIRRSGE
ncbi:hypothetical protein U27_05878 [Candidatus Vecturithrix granuli]|uniref:Xanthine dehydrogenase accessory factor n=1 Tax=Vecturithrix granuli TaxID=1499967 RepID=A0A081C2U8_VECG1|nr:hypothetical protein U27_05878 [Candidatus Vecturithrix granuli]